ncbi:hypothetical protein [Romboutsia sp.]|uniref:hypothetical protein n=1 Tax=Romboutsia sp. TaxID=1965302 RepID=UPI002CDD472C|nr:hypothetical protein [Romboutsia sp.]HSQ90171.1 hypothetical protein [Romboutsia sp.]
MEFTLEYKKDIFDYLLMFASLVALLCDKDNLAIILAMIVLFSDLYAKIKKKRNGENK